MTRTIVETQPETPARAGSSEVARPPSTSALWRAGAGVDRPHVVSLTPPLYQDKCKGDSWYRVLTGGTIGRKKVAPHRPRLRDWLERRRCRRLDSDIAPVPPPRQPVPPHDPTRPVHGPFAENFRWVYLPGWPHGPIHCTPSQARIFEVLWNSKAVPRKKGEIVGEAGIDSDKPIDVFKVKAQYKGNSKKEGPLAAYHALVETNRRAGLHWMPCAKRP
jgi:hypothetical protein